MPLSDADRAFLAHDWRWLESSDAAIKTRHPGAREADYGSCFMNAAGATVAINIIAAITGPGGRLITATVDGVPAISFKSRPRTVRLYHSRFAGDPVSGQLFMVEGYSVDYAAQRTTLNLVG